MTETDLPLRVMRVDSHAGRNTADEYGIDFDVVAAFDECGIADRDPFIIGWDGYWPVNYNRWLTDNDVRVDLKANTRYVYARGLLAADEYLRSTGDDRAVLEVGTPDVRRMIAALVVAEGGGVRSAATTTKNGVGQALDSYFGWAVEAGIIDRSPVPRRRRRGRWGDIQGKDASDLYRRPTQKPPEFLSLDDVQRLNHGLMRTPGGRLRRTARRNSAMNGLLVTTGLRVEEAGSLLLAEIEGPRGAATQHWLSASTAKYESERPFRIQSSTRHLLDTYDLERGAAVARARRQRRYDVDLWDGVVTHTSGGGDRLKLHLAGSSRKWVMAGGLDSWARRRLLRVDANGEVEPAMLWLTDSGMPFDYEEWVGVYNRANWVFNQMGPSPLRVHATPHTMRHTFGTAMLGRLIAASAAATEATEALMLPDGPDLRTIMRVCYDPLIKVSEMLGHSSPDITLRYCHSIAQVATAVDGVLEGWATEAGLLLTEGPAA